MGFKCSPKTVFALAFLLSIFTTATTWAYAPEGELLKIKGYSPEVIQTADTQRDRKEWREPSAPKSSPLERFIHNVYYGNWTGDIDAFGSGVIRGDD